jgi:hypothetical protein
MKRLYFFIVMVLLSNPIHAQLYINEFMASNSNTIADEFDEYDDWVEIFNNNDYSINLSGYYLTDDLGNSTKWASLISLYQAKIFY